MESVLGRKGSRREACVRACVRARVGCVRGHSPALLSASDGMDAGCAEQRKRCAPPALTVKRAEKGGAYENQVSSAGPVAEYDFFSPSVATG